MRLSAVCLALLFAALAHSKPEGSWKWGSSSDSAATTAAPATLPVAGKSVEHETRRERPCLISAFTDESKTSAAIDADAAADAILTATRNGKVINTYEKVYEDQQVQEALQKGNDTEARTYIK